MNTRIGDPTSSQLGRQDRERQVLTDELVGAFTVITVDARAGQSVSRCTRRPWSPGCIAGSDP